MDWLPIHLTDPQSQAESDELMRRLLEADVVASVATEDMVISHGLGGSMAVLAGAILVQSGHSERAYEIYEAYCEEQERKDGGLVETPLPWKCVTCGESHTADMTHCWTCGTSHTGEVDPSVVAEAEQVRANQSIKPEIERAFDRAGVMRAQDTSDPYDPDESEGERLARRAFEVALVGVLLFPPMLHFAVLGILRQLKREGHPLTDRGRRHVRIAAIIAWSVILGLLTLAGVWMLSASTLDPWA